MLIQPLRKIQPPRHRLLAPALLIAAVLAGCATSPRVTGPAALDLSATDAVAAIRTGRLSAVDYVDAVLARADANKDLNALISVNAEGARNAALAIDARRAQGQPLPPLAGLPIVVKDNINTKDLPTTGGTPALASNRPAANAPTVQKLLDAGAIVIGKSNLHELAFGITSTNATRFAPASGLSGGPVRNPYDKSLIPGGSPGGTAGAIAARIVPAGLGTDTGGSTRVPAALTGIAGFRPSVGDGGNQRRYHDPNAVVPISHTRDTVGPMARTVADIALLDATIHGEALPAPVSLKGVRIGIPNVLWAGIAKETETTLLAAKARLAAAGAVLVDIDMGELPALNAKISFTIALHEPIDDIPAYLNASGSPVRTVRDLADKIASKDVQGAFGAIQGDVFGAQYGDAMKTHRPALQAYYARAFEEHRIAALLFPTTPSAAVPVDEANGSSKMMLDGAAVDTFGTMIRNTDPGSNAGIPGLSIPAGMTASGLPVGLEIDGPLGSDRALLALGIAIEKVLGPVPAPR